MYRISKQSFLTLTIIFLVLFGVSVFIMILYCWGYHKLRKQAKDNTTELGKLYNEENGYSNMPTDVVA